jgi:very-short-patch-repair endonuclease
MQSKAHTQPYRSTDRALRERGLAALAGRQHGVVGRDQLLALGLGDGAIKARLQLGQLHSIHRGVYSVGHGRLTVRSKWLAAVLASGDGAVLSHGSAAALWGLMRPRWSPVDITSSHGRPGRDGIVLHRSPLQDDERAVEARIPVTSVARTLLDLAGVLDGDSLQRAFEEADRLKLLQLPELERICARAGKRKGLPALRGLAAAAREPVTTRSPLEDRFAEFCRKHLADLPAPLANVSILGHEADAYWPSHRLIVELDGFAYHRHRAAFESDRARDAAMQAAGYRVIRLTHRQLESEAHRITIQLRKLLGADRRQPVG